MSNRRKKVVVAMSGGVDSSVTAGLLVKQGYDVRGVSLRLWEGGELGPRNCSDHRGAKDVADLLGISHTLLDLRAQFVESVVKPFARDYLGGRTPNPCIACNRDFKLGTLLNWAKEQGADYVATGHYAKIVRDCSEHACLFRGNDREKDQTYFLFALSQDQLAHTLFPLGAMKKGDVREQARRLGLPVADRAESQDICFGDYKALVESYAKQDDLGCGDVVDRSGKLLGRHAGIHGVTIGQRRGLGIAAAQPLYVVDIQEQSKRVVLGTRDELGCKGLMAGNLNWIEPFDEEEMAAAVQIRYRSPAISCVIRKTAEGTSEVRFTEEFPAVTPGQAAVFYRGDQLLGGGWITQAIR